jgi:cob(I)alamin adenosyltransferase
MAEESRRGRGLVIFYTGEGKGKTTAALGLALRAVGAGLRVLVIQFIKGKWRYGELEAAKRLAPDMELRAMGKGFVGIMGDTLPFEEHVKAAKEALDAAVDGLTSGTHDMVILDEAFTACSVGLLSVGDLRRVLESRPAGVHLILTGRGAPEELFGEANIVTEMRKVKHVYDEGVRGVRGIEF